MKRFLILSLAVLLSACAPTGSGSSSKTTLLSAAAVVASNDPSAIRAEKLAKIADTLLSTGAAQQAGEVAAVAIEIDPTNTRAGLIAAVSKPLSQLRGFATRLEGYLSSSQIFSRTSFATAVRVAKESHWGYYSLAKPGFDTFLYEKVTAERTVFTSEIPLQETLDSVIASFDELRKFSKAHKDDSVTISATTTLIPDLIERYANACLVHEDAKLTYRLECPADSTRSLVTLDRADFEIMTDMASYYELALSMFAAYDIRGVAKSQSSPLYSLIYGKSYAGTQQTYFADALTTAMKVPEFGKLRATSRLSEIKNMGLDLVNGLNWAQSNQALLCPKGQQNGANRIGKLFNEGFCVSGGFGPYLQVISDVAAGKTVQLMKPDGSMTDFSPSSFLDKPPADLRQLGAIKIENNQLTSIGDGTLAGAFPKGDFNDILGAPAATPTPAPTPASP